MQEVVGSIPTGSTNLSLVALGRPNRLQAVFRSCIMKKGGASRHRPLWNLRLKSDGDDGAARDGEAVLFEARIDGGDH